MKTLKYFCALIGLMSLFSAAAAQNDSIWISSGANILAVGHRASDTLFNGWIYKTGDDTTVCDSSSTVLTINYSQPIDHVQWTTNPSQGTFSTFTITVFPTMTTDYAVAVYYDDGSPGGQYVGQVVITVFIMQYPQTYDWVLDGVVDGDSAHYCVGDEVMGYTDSQIGATYQPADFYTTIDAGSPVNGTGNAITFPALPAGVYYLKISNGLCTVNDY